MSRSVLTSLSLLLLFAFSARGQEPRAGAISFVPYSLKTYDEQEHPAELGKLWASENRGKNSSRLIQLAFVRLKTTAANPQPPIVFLAGGPGIPGTGMGRVPVYFHLFARLQEVADVILLDQRGTGLSAPNLQCPPGKGLAPYMWEAREKAAQALVELVQGGRLEIPLERHFSPDPTPKGCYRSSPRIVSLDGGIYEKHIRPSNIDRNSAWSYGTDRE
jgi:hypothetical protein